MRRILMLFVVLATFGAMSLSSVAEANHKGFCPIVAVDHAKELNLSKDQKSALKKLKKQAKQQMKAISDQTEAILTPAQRKQYDAIPDMMGNGSCQKKDKDCKKDGSCSMKKK
jgi:hypothetical protein